MVSVAVLDSLSPLQIRFQSTNQRKGGRGKRGGEERGVKREGGMKGLSEGNGRRKRRKQEGKKKYEEWDQGGDSYRRRSLGT